jgi:hypothetical protein
MANAIVKLPPDEKQRLLETLAAEARERKPLKSVEQLVAEQGTRPLEFEEMLGDFWPEEESVDDFLAAWRTWRSEGEQRGLD